MAEFEIYTLSVRSILESVNCKKIIENDNKENITLDLSKGFIYESTVSSVDMVSENAFFYQALKALATAEVSSADKTELHKQFVCLRNKRQSLLNHMVVLNFSDVFNKNKDMASAGEVLLEKGLFIAFPTYDNNSKKNNDEEEKTFIHFEASDKSGSMAKANKIYFVENDTKNGLKIKYDGNVCGLKTELYRRLMLDLVGNRNNSTAIKSKIYSYRGLYLTDASRIIVNDAGLKRDEIDRKEENCLGPLLNAETVIVIADKEARCKKSEDEKSMITATGIDKDENGKTIFQLKTQTNKEKFSQDTINYFDGEGLICPNYSDLINEQLGDREAKNATSYQIRMPFCKGMLHRVDFNRIIVNEWNKRDGSTELKGEAKIKDAFGIERDLSKVKIILTKSMFKAFKWFKKCCKDLGHEDPMKYYFDQFNEFDHSLYISQIDTVHIRNLGKTKINYQIINPLALDDQDISLEKILTEHKSVIESMNSNPIETYLQVTANNVTVDENGELSDSDDCQIKRDKSAWISAIKYDRKFADERYVSIKLRQFQISLIMDILKGRLVVDGEVRYLSSDLFALIRHIIDNCEFKGMDNKAKKDWMDELKKKCLFANEFFLPGSKLDLSYEKQEHRCAFFRNPHLARNEEVLLQVQKKGKKGESNIYKEYFGDLKGIVMLGRNSTAPATLGGADFDGDLVRIINNEVVKKAVERGIKATSTQDGVQRELPYIDIPDPAKGNNPNIAKIEEKIDPVTIRNTFSSRVGHISNTAVRLGQIEYADHKGEIKGIKGDLSGLDKIDDKDSLCAEGCIVVGLEIDANKTGVHPSLKNLTAYNEKREAYLKAKLNKREAEKDYLYYLTELQKYKLFNDGNFILIKDEVRGGFEIKKHKDDNHPFHVPPKNKDAEIGKNKLEILPWECLEERREVKSNPGSTPRKQLFNFQDKKGAIIDIDRNVKKEVKSIIDAYKAVEKESRDRNNNIRKYKKSNYVGKIHTILTEQYGELSNLGITKEGKIKKYDPKEDMSEIESVLFGIFDFINNYVETWHNKNREDGKSGINEKELLLKRIIDGEWLFVEAEDRKNTLNNEIFKADDFKENVQKQEDDVRKQTTPKLSQAMITLLTNFNCKGYKLLYYIVKDIYGKSKEDDDILLLNELEDEPDVSGDDEKVKLKREEKLKNNQYWVAYKKKFHDAAIRRTGETDWKKSLREQCKIDLGLLMRMHGLKPNSKLRYVYSSDKNFFWEIFSWDDIKSSTLGYINKHSKKEIDENA